MENLRSLLALCALSFLLSACETTPDPPNPQQQLVERGRDIFFDETFDGNGRTCGTCHREDNNFTIVVKKRGQELTTLKAGIASARWAISRVTVEPPPSRPSTMFVS